MPDLFFVFSVREARRKANKNGQIRQVFFFPKRVKGDPLYLGGNPFVLFRPRQEH